jgi:hypothetical protein
MSIAVACPSCGSKLKVLDKYAGQRIKCPDCGKPLSVPEASLEENVKAFITTEPPSLRDAVARKNASRSEDDYGEELEDRRQRSGDSGRLQPTVHVSIASHSLGIASLVLGVLAFVFSVIPCFGIVSLPVSGLGLLLGVAGGVVCFMRKGSGIGYPIAGAPVNLLALVIAGFWLGLISNASKKVDEALKERGTAKQSFNPAENSPTPTAAHPEISPARPTVRMTSDQLLSQYAANEVAASRKFNDQWIEVSGGVLEIRQVGNDGSSAVVLRNINEHLYTRHVACYFSAKSRDVERLTKGGFVRVVGKCSMHTTNYVALDDCRVTETNP